MTTGSGGRGRRLFSRRGVLKTVGTTPLLATVSTNSRAKSSADAEHWRQSGYDARRSATATTNTGPGDEVEPTWPSTAVPRDDAVSVSSPLRIADERVYAELAFADDERTSLCALAAGTGELLWRTPVDEVRGLVVGNGRVYAVDARNAGAVLRCYDSADGTGEWEQSLSGSAGDGPTSLLVHRGSVYLTGDDTVLAFDAATGEPRWTHDVGYDRDVDTSTMGGIAASGSNLYVTTAIGGYRLGDADGYAQETFVHRLSTASGERGWRVRFTDTSGLAPPAPVVGEDGIYVASNDSTDNVGRLVALDATGSRRWTHETSLIKTSPSLARGALYVVTFADGVWRLRSISTDGTENWRRTLDDERVVNRAPTVVGDAVYTVAKGMESDVLAAFSTDDGELLWERSHEAERASVAMSHYSVVERSLPVAHGGVFYATDRSPGTMAVLSTGGRLTGVPTPTTEPSTRTTTAPTTTGTRTTTGRESTTATPTTGREATTAGSPTTGRESTTTAETPSASNDDSGLPVVPLVGGGALLFGTGLAALWYRRTGEGSSTAADGARTDHEDVDAGYAEAHVEHEPIEPDRASTEPDRTPTEPDHAPEGPDHATTESDHAESDYAESDHTEPDHAESDHPTAGPDPTEPESEPDRANPDPDDAARARGKPSDSAVTAAGESSNRVRVRNVDERRIRCRVRCRTPEETSYLRERELAPGEETTVGNHPDDRPFEITVSVKDGPTEKQAFRPAQQSVGDVVIGVRGDAIAIRRRA